MNLKIKYLLMFCTFIGIASCTQKNERVEYVDPVEFSSKIFKGINYEYLSMLKKEKTEINLVYVKKKDMSKNYFNDNVIKEMKNEGWREIKPEFQDQNLFCFSANNMMSVVYPTKEIYRNLKGDTLTIKKENLDKWVISYIYSFHGFEECKT
ncbi:MULTISPECIES: hypothetical protein [Acinetobacter]|uniref:Uncharacterized protein n=1 Tax=Acinetobacter bereziniae TaxID=106648 RepID=A0A8I1AEI0_ACIBZ|nr:MULTISPECIES: hypothetical protein [Acinetobacter]MBI0395707.1 hypothetical protein [Acinetobacter bereziniae]MBJ9374533.1 hypothetical protein [Acinetobacter sp. TGL-Y2]QQC83093.1 hypothetical protein I9190_12345 [Acinetobacter bereziniae]UUN96249.1 hypothetical protein I9054_012765 [Acinetobacter bereziniae]